MIGKIVSVITALAKVPGILKFFHGIFNNQVVDTFKAPKVTFQTAGQEHAMKKRMKVMPRRNDVVRFKEKDYKVKDVYWFLEKNEVFINLEDY